MKKPYYQRLERAIRAAERQYEGHTFAIEQMREANYYLNRDPELADRIGTYADELIERSERMRRRALARYSALMQALTRPRRTPGCTCTDMQLNLVGCDCGAER